MSTFTPREIRRKTLQNAIYSCLNGDKEVEPVVKNMYSNVWLVARTAADAVRALDDTAGTTAAAPSEAAERHDRNR